MFFAIFGGFCEKLGLSPNLVVFSSLSFRVISSSFLIFFTWLLKSGYVYFSMIWFVTFRAYYMFVKSWCIKHTQSTCSGLIILWFFFHSILLRWIKYCICMFFIICPLNIHGYCTGSFPPSFFVDYLLENNQWSRVEHPILSMVLYHPFCSYVDDFLAFFPMF